MPFVMLMKRSGQSAWNSAKIVDGAVATADLADGSITTAKIADGAVQVADIGTGAVTLQKIAADAVDRTRLHPTVRRAIPKAPEIYDQAVSPNYTASSGGDHIQFVPVDIERLGNVLKFANTALVPLLIALVAIAVGIVNARARRRPA